ncbi:MAG: magnesium/cobalt transporter CorA [Gemmatimonadota bacterium]|nr:magnesium/cobalt transporter CorA [Gemmatimonadota bacterium]
MQQLFHRRSRKTGHPPGTLVHIGDEHTGPVEITVIDYTATTFDERVVASVEECFQYRDTPSVTWINVDGVHDVSIVERLGEYYGLHALALEDVVHTDQRPKVEDFGDRLYTVLRMLSVRREDGEDESQVTVESEQLSILLGPTFVVTFQEQGGDVFDPIRERLRTSRGRVRKLGADYLAYALIDIVVDNYFTVLEQLGDQAEDLEAELIEEPSRDTLAEIQGMKRAMIQMRRAVWPLRDVLNVLLRGDSQLIKKTTMPFLRDVYDHAVRVVDIVETYREMIGGMLDIYLSNVSNRMNEVMKTLTVMASIFIPLTFVAGVYGMNFDNIPELHWAYGYWYVWAIMLAVGLVMLLYFRRKHWL